MKKYTGYVLSVGILVAAFASTAVAESMSFVTTLSQPMGVFRRVEMTEPSVIKDLYMVGLKKGGVQASVTGTPVNITTLLKTDENIGGTIEIDTGYKASLTMKGPTLSTMNFGKPEYYDLYGQNPTFKTAESSLTNISNFRLLVENSTAGFTPARPRGTYYQTKLIWTNELVITENSGTNSGQVIFHYDQDNLCSKGLYGTNFTWANGGMLKGIPSTDCSDAVLNAGVLQ